MLRFGLCACGGFIERGVLPALESAGFARAVALFDVNAERVRLLAERFGIEHRCGSYAQMLARDDVDAVYIASPNALHREQTIAAAGAGKHVFCQKPLGIDAAECRDMVAACRAAGVRLGAGFCFRYAGAQVKAREILLSGAIGEARTFRISLNFYGYTPEAVGWRCDARLAGGGPLMDLAPHMVDLACFFLDARVESAMAYVHPEKTDERIETDAVAVLRMTNGTTAMLDTSFNVRADPPAYAVAGTAGVIRRWGIDPWRLNGKPAGTLTVEKDNQPPLPVEFPPHEYLDRELAAFCRAVESGREPPVSGQYGLEIQAAIDAIYESGRTGQRQQVPAQDADTTGPVTR